MSLREQPTRAKREATEWLDCYNNVHKKLPPDEQKKAAQEMGAEYERARQSVASERDGLRAAGFKTLPELFQALGKTAEVRAWYDEGCPADRKPKPLRRLG